MLLSSENQTMVPKGQLPWICKGASIMFAVSAVVTMVPLFFLVLFFQRQIVSGLTAGAVRVKNNKTQQKIIWQVAKLRLRTTYIVVNIYVTS